MRTKSKNFIDFNKMTDKNSRVASRMAHNESLENLKLTMNSNLNKSVRSLKFNDQSDLINLNTQSTFNFNSTNPVTSRSKENFELLNTENLFHSKSEKKKKKNVKGPTFSKSLSRERLDRIKNEKFLTHSLIIPKFDYIYPSKILF